MIDGVLIALARVLTGPVAFRHDFDFEPCVQRIYYANHTSHMDTLLISSLIPARQRASVHPVAAEDYWWSSPWRRYFAERVFHAIPLVRKCGRSSGESMNDLEAALARGASFIVFPEGTRGGGDKIQRFKGGLYRLAAMRPGVELVPVYINSLSRVLPKGAWFPVPILCAVHFGRGFTLEPRETKSQFIARAEANLEALSAL